MTVCCVSGCKNSTKRNKELSFHHFPDKTKRPAIYKSWLSKIKRDKFIPRKSTLICSEHFLTRDYETSTILKKQLMPDKKPKLMLKVDALPSLKLVGKGSNRKKNSRPESSYIKLKKNAEQHHVISETESEENTQEEPNSTRVDDSRSLKKEYLNPPPAKVATSKTSSTNTSYRRSMRVISPKRAKIRKTIEQSNIEKVIQDLQEISERLNAAADDNEFDYFGKSMACQLKQLPEPVALESMAEIQSYLVKQRLKVINGDNQSEPSLVVHNEENSAHSSSSPYESYDFECKYECKYEPV